MRRCGTRPPAWLGNTTQPRLPEATTMARESVRMCTLLENGQCQLG
jgi:hypothetical protein